MLNFIDNTMKSIQLLSVVLSLIMVFGVSADSAFAQNNDDEHDDNSINNDNYDDDRYDDDRYDDDRYDDDRYDDDRYDDDRYDDDRYDDDRYDDDRYDDDRYDDDRYDDDKKEDRHDDLEDKLEQYCEMNPNELAIFFDEHPRIAQFEDRLANYCDLSEDEREDAIEEFIEEYFPQTREYDDELEDKLEQYCEMNPNERVEFIKIHEKTKDHVTKMNEYCDLSEDEREAFIEEHEDEYEMHHDKDMKEKLETYCEMSDQERTVFLTEHEKSNDHAEKMNRYCTLDENTKAEFIEEHREEYKVHMKEKNAYKSKEKHHMDYDRLCSLSESERASEIDDSEKLQRLTNWCDMTPQEREDYKKEHHGEKTTSKMHANAMNDVPDKVKMAEMSPRLKEMIMDKRSISDEKLDEIKIKYQEKYGNITDEKKSELHMKFQEHMSSKTIKISDEHKSAIHDRVAEMKAFKTELRERSANMTDEEKQQLREEFIEKAKEIQLAWISPRAQINAGVDSVDVECREGFSLVMKSSNGVPMCLKADTALKMIERGLAVPAN